MDGMGHGGASRRTQRCSRAHLGGGADGGRRCGERRNGALEEGSDLLGGHLGEHGAEGRRGRLAHVRLALLEADDGLHLLRVRLQARAEKLGRRLPHRRLQRGRSEGAAGVRRVCGEGEARVRRG